MKHILKPVTAAVGAIILVVSLPACVGEPASPAQRGTNELGPYPTATSQIAVSAECAGRGSIEVAVADVGSFREAQGDDSLQWGVSVIAVADR